MGDRNRKPTPFLRSSVGFQPPLGTKVAKVSKSLVTPSVPSMLMSPSEPAPTSCSGGTEMEKPVTKRDVRLGVIPPLKQLLAFTSLRLARLARLKSCLPGVRSSRMSSRFTEYKFPLGNTHYLTKIDKVLYYKNHPLQKCVWNVEYADCLSYQNIATEQTGDTASCQNFTKAT